MKARKTYLLALDPKYASDMSRAVKSSLSADSVLVVTDLHSLIDTLDVILPDVILLDLDLTEVKNWDPLQPLEWLQSRIMGSTPVVVMHKKCDVALYERILRMGAADCVDLDVMGDSAAELCEVLQEATLPRSHAFKRISRACREGAASCRLTKKLLGRLSA